ncbi:MAG: hypothetical protein M0P30_03455 [Syntrophorhabdaceae bacterium]|nr:hypothetical protein [Syntrophorhabdaceae bacterium]
MFWDRDKPRRTRKSGARANRIQELANKLYNEGKFGDLESELLKFDPADLNDNEKESWYHAYGVVSFRRHDRETAFERFKEGVKQCPRSGNLSFSLGQEYELRGDVENMLACFDKALFPSVPAQYVLAEAKYAYLWDRTDKSRFYIDSLLPVYFKFKVLDTTFLMMRGLPPFEQVWAYLAAFSQLEDNFDMLDKITERVERTCSDLNCEFLKAELEGFRSGDFSSLKNMLRSLILDSIARKYPYGHQAMRLNVLLTQETRGFVEAMTMLDSVVLTGKDFPWLDDIRLLAKCELMGRTNNTAEEARLKSQFVERQPFLFEPDIAVNFNLLRYQEKLKQDFRRTRPVW